MVTAVCQCCYHYNVLQECETSGCCLQHYQRNGRPRHSQVRTSSKVNVALFPGSSSPGPFPGGGGEGSLGTRPSKNQKGGSGTSAGVEVYTAPSMKAHFRLAFDSHSDVHLLEMLTAREPFSRFASFYNVVNTKQGR